MVGVICSIVASEAEGFALGRVLEHGHHGLEHVLGTEAAFALAGDQARLHDRRLADEGEAPERYRKLVDEYYKRLSNGSQPQQK